MSERAYGRLLDKCEKLEADNERLTRERDEVSLLAVNRLIKIDRLRSALDGVQESTDLDDAHGIARRALETRP